MSCLKALDHLKIDHPIIEQIMYKLMSLKASGFDIHLCWLPGHVGKGKKVGGEGGRREGGHAGKMEGGRERDGRGRGRKEREGAAEKGRQEGDGGQGAWEEGAGGSGGQRWAGWGGRARG